MATGKTAKSILISLGIRLEKFNLSTIASVTTVDEMELPVIGEKKTALFAIIPDNDSSFNFIVGMLYTQLFQSPCTWPTTSTEAVCPFMSTSSWTTSTIFSSTRISADG